MSRKFKQKSRKSKQKLFFVFLTNPGNPNKNPGNQNKKPGDPNKKPEIQT
jgi:hypothetical protein